MADKEKAVKSRSKKMRRSPLQSDKGDDSMADSNSIGARSGTRPPSATIMRLFVANSDGGRSECSDDSCNEEPTTRPGTADKLSGKNPRWLAAQEKHYQADAIRERIHSLLLDIDAAEADSESVLKKSWLTAKRQELQKISLKQPGEIMDFEPVVDKLERRLQEVRNSNRKSGKKGNKTGKRIASGSESEKDGNLSDGSSGSGEEAESRDDKTSSRGSKNASNNDRRETREDMEEQDEERDAKKKGGMNASKGTKVAVANNPKDEMEQQINTVSQASEKDADNTPKNDKKTSNVKKKGESHIGSAVIEHSDTDEFESDAKHGRERKQKWKENEKDRNDKMAEKEKEKKRETETCKKENRSVAEIEENGVKEKKGKDKKSGKEEMDKESEKEKKGKDKKSGKKEMEKESEKEKKGKDKKSGKEEMDKESEKEKKGKDKKSGKVEMEIKKNRGKKKEDKLFETEMSERQDDRKGKEGTEKSKSSNVEKRRRKDSESDAKRSESENESAIAKPKWRLPMKSVIKLPSRKKGPAKLPKGTCAAELSAEEDDGSEGSCSDSDQDGGRASFWGERVGTPKDVATKPKRRLSADSGDGQPPSTSASSDEEVIDAQVTTFVLEIDALSDNDRVDKVALKELPTSGKRRDKRKKKTDLPSARKESAIADIPLLRESVRQKLRDTFSFKRKSKRSDDVGDDLEDGKDSKSKKKDKVKKNKEKEKAIEKQNGKKEEADDKQHNKKSSSKLKASRAADSDSEDDSTSPGDRTSRTSRGPPAATALATSKPLKSPKVDEALHCISLDDD